MAAGNMADGIGHGEDRQPESERHPDQPAPDLGKGGGDHRAPAPPEHHPEGPDQFRRELAHPLTPCCRVERNNRKHAVRPRYPAKSGGLNRKPPPSVPSGGFVLSTFKRAFRRARPPAPRPSRPAGP